MAAVGTKGDASGLESRQKHQEKVFYLRCLSFCSTTNTLPKYHVAFQVRIPGFEKGSGAAQNEITVGGHPDGWLQDVKKSTLAVETEV